jgi:coenzyme F420-reducing hydrogenase beta subunit
VLFTGTPCQIEGLFSYLGNDNFNFLYTQDIICQGVPSPSVWSEYLKYRANGANIKDVSFRDKEYGWHYFSMKIDTDKKKYTKRFDEDLFVRLFLDNTILRPSCYACKYKKKVRISDFTLADCWQPATVNSQLKDDDKGLSMMFINTEKGQVLFDSINDNYTVQEIDYGLAITSQQAAVLSVKPNIHRSDFFVEFSNKDFKYIDENWYGNDVITNSKKALIYHKFKLNTKIRR